AGARALAIDAHSGAPGALTPAHDLQLAAAADGRIDPHVARTLRPALAFAASLRLDRQLADGRLEDDVELGTCRHAGPDLPHREATQLGGAGSLRLRLRLRHVGHCRAELDGDVAAGRLNVEERTRRRRREIR